MKIVFGLQTSAKVMGKFRLPPNVAHVTKPWRASDVAGNGLIIRQLPWRWSISWGF